MTLSIAFVIKRDESISESSYYVCFSVFVVTFLYMPPPLSPSSTPPHPAATSIRSIYRLQEREWRSIPSHSHMSSRLFGKIGRIATGEATLELICSKCIPVLIYDLEACHLLKSDLSSLDFVVNRFFMKLFRTYSTDIVKQCQYQFSFPLPSHLWAKRVQKFDACSNLSCKIDVR